VASVGVLEHVRETGGSESANLREIVRVLEPGGFFVCYHFPNRTSWIDFLAARSRRHHHFYRYGRADIARLLRDARLETIALERYGLLPRNSLSRLSGSLRRSQVVADLWDAADHVLGALLGPLCQNWMFVGRKPGPPLVTTGFSRAMRRVPRDRTR
jgi:hypothetical protein